MLGDLNYERCLQHLPGPLPRQSFESITAIFGGREGQS